MSDGLFRGKPYGLVWDHLGDVSSGSIQEDWDLFLSNASTLKHHLEAYGQIPSWEMAFCGGTPELANPQSYAWSWPSVLIYLMEPFWAFVSLWLILSLVGLVSVHLLLRKHAIPSMVSAGVGLAYVSSGYFAARFNVGHVTFAFFHFIPLLLLLSDRLLFEHRQSAITSQQFFVFVFASFLFFSAALPVAVFYFYPALLIFLVVKFFVVHKDLKPKPWQDFVYRWGIPHGFGFFLASYKWVPVLAWQKMFPRGLTEPESSDVFAVFYDLVRTVPSFHEIDAFATGRPWGIWENFNYVGTPWLLLALVGLCWPSANNRAPYRVLRWVSLLLVLSGTSLALGNDQTLGLGALFRSLPVFDSIRSFSRYNILITFGVFLAAARAFGLILGSRSQRPHWFKSGAQALGLTVALVPLWAQSFVLVKNTTLIPSTELQKVFALEPLPPYSANTVINYGTGHPRFYFQNHLFQKGRNVIRCNQPLKTIIDGAPKFHITNEPLSMPEATQVRAETDGLSLLFEPPVSGRVQIRIPFHPTYVLEHRGRALPVQQDDLGGFALQLDEPMGQIRIKAKQPGVVWGVAQSGGAAIALVVFWVLRRRRAARFEAVSR